MGVVIVPAPECDTKQTHTPTRTQTGMLGIQTKCLAENLEEK